MGLVDPPPWKNEAKTKKEKTGVRERLLALLKTLFDHIGVGPLFTISSLIVALVAGKVATYHFEATALLKQLSENRATYEHALSEMQNKIEERIPERVRSPLPIFPKNEGSLIFQTKNGRSEMDLDLELEWVDRDRKHRHKYLVQVVCIAEISGDKFSVNPETNRHTQPPCGPDKLNGETPNGDKSFYWTQPGESSREVKIKAPGTYAWRVARGEPKGNGGKAIFEEWSPYFIFTVFKSIETRVKAMQEVRVGIAEGSLLEKKVEGDGEDNGLAKLETDLVDTIQKEHFTLKQEQKRYLSYPTYDALIEGVVRGEVDYAIGEITRTRAREKLGVFFTQGYREAMPILVTELSGTRPPGKGDTIGVLSGTVHEKVLTELAKSYQFTIVREPRLQDLQRDLQKGTVSFIFSGEESLKPLRVLENSRGQRKFHFNDALSSKVSDYYMTDMNHFSYPPMYAIATADRFQCEKLDEHVRSAVEENRSSFRKNENYFQMQEKPCRED